MSKTTLRQNRHSAKIRIDTSILLDRLENAEAALTEMAEDLCADDEGIAVDVRELRIRVATALGALVTVRREAEGIPVNLGDGAAPEPAAADPAWSVALGNVRGLADQARQGIQRTLNALSCALSNDDVEPDEVAGLFTALEACNVIDLEVDAVCGREAAKAVAS